jgi:putative heme transporter
MTCPGDSAPEPPSRHDRPVNVPPVPPNLERAASWSWRLLACAAALLAVIALLWYLRVIVLPIMVALTIAPALEPIAARLRSLKLERPAAAIALLIGLAVVAGLVAIVTTSVLEQWEELRDTVSEAVDDITNRLESEPFNLSFDRTEDLRSSLSDSWGEASSYAVTGV